MNYTVHITGSGSLAETAEALTKIAASLRQIDNSLEQGITLSNFTTEDAILCGVFSEIEE